MHHLLAADDDVRDAVVARLGEGVLGVEGRPDRARIAQRVFRDPEQLDWLEKLLHPLVSREYLEWREQLARLDDLPPVCVTEVPLLFEVGADEKFDKVVVITAPAALREQRRRVARDDRDSRLLLDREKVRRADYHYVNTGTFDDLHEWVGGVRWSPGGRGHSRMRRVALAVLLLVAAGAGVAAWAVSSEPEWYQRVRYPLRYEAIVRTHARNYDLSPTPLRRSSTRRASSTRPRARTRARWASCSSCPRRRRGLPSDGWRRVRRGGPARPRDQRALRLVVPQEPPEPLRGSLHRTRRLPRRTGQRPVARREPVSSSPRRRRT